MNTGKFLHRGMMCKLVKETLRFNNLSIDRYSTHSFRIGAATTAAAAGIPDSKIKILGRWSSSVYQRHVRMSLNVRASLKLWLLSLLYLELGFHTDEVPEQMSQSHYLDSLSTWFVLWGIVWAHKCCYNIDRGLMTV